MKVIEKLDNLYNQCTPINDIVCETLDYKIFRHSKYIRFCNSKNLLNFIPTGDDKRIDAICGFINENPYFWMLPLASSNPDKHFGYVLKSYHQKQYRNVFCNEHICSFYGFQNFTDFKYGTPIILVEGTKDQIVVSSLYKYTLGCLTSGLNGFDDITAITRLTNKVILCYDNDDAGKKSTARDVERLRKIGCKVAIAFYNSKDPGELHNNPIGLQILNQSLSSILKNL